MSVSAVYTADVCITVLIVTAIVRGVSRCLLLQSDSLACMSKACIPDSGSVRATTEMWAWHGLLCFPYTLV